MPPSQAWIYTANLVIKNILTDARELLRIDSDDDFHNIQ